MPYEEKVGVLIKNLDVSNYISPLKLFDYLASGSVIIASNKKAYDHILKHKFNCFLINSSKDKEWAKIIDLIFSKNLTPKQSKKIQLKQQKNTAGLKESMLLIILILEFKIIFCPIPKLLLLKNKC